ncbi:MAG: hypothetical protein ABIZ80_21495, partial [Bryobacteraceae bacterium]
MAISRPNRGGALLAVMWLSLALAAIAFSLASTVRGETERTSSAIDGLRSYYLATGAIERAILYMQWGAEYYTPGMPLFRFPFPTGETEVEIMPEAAKLNINTAPPEALLRLMEAIGVPGPQAFQVVEAIVDWRTAKPVSPLDQFYLAQTPSFQAPHASFEQI